MKIIYFINLGHYLINQGIIKKTFKKATVWRTNGHNVKLVFIYDTEKEKELIERFGLCEFVKRINQNFMGEFRLKRMIGICPAHEQTLFEIISDFEPDIVYHRDFELSKLLKKIAKKSATILEVNGNEIGNLLLGKKDFYHFILNYYRALIFKLFLKSYLQQHRGVVFVTHELLELFQAQSSYKGLKAQSTVIPNGIDINDQVRKKAENTEKIKVVFLGTPDLPWHGLDIIIDIAIRTEEQLEFHIIGQTFNESTLPSNVKIYGYLSEAAYKRILSECHIGLGTLSLSSAGITEASPLKVREYVAAGLPVIVGYKDTAFLRHGTPQWALELPNNRNEILASKNEIIGFCQRFKNYSVPIDEAKKYFSIDELEKDRLAFFEILKM